MFIIYPVHLKVPTDGTYHIDVHINSNLGQIRASGWLMVDGTHYMKLWNSLEGTGSTHYPTSHMSGPVKLQAGQKVWVKNGDQSVILGRENVSNEMFSWFSGYILFADN